MSSDIVMLHVRFAPDGGVVEISERPTPNSAQAWFDWVSLNAPDAYQALSGGRGVFRHDARQARRTAREHRRQQCGGLIWPIASRKRIPSAKDVLRKGSLVSGQEGFGETGALFGRIEPIRDGPFIVVK